MIDFYYHFAVNPIKVAIFLEEAALEYKCIPIDILSGDQLSSSFKALNPNCKVPVIVEDCHVIFDSNAILLYLAERNNVFLPPASDRGTLLSWLMYVASGLGPYCGQAAHFRRFAPEPKEYALSRYDFEARRHYGVLDERLASREWLVGDSYSIADMAAWPWVRNIDSVLGPEEQAGFPNLMTWFNRIGERPAVQRALELKNRFHLKAEVDEGALGYLCRHRSAHKPSGGPQ